MALIDVIRRAEYPVYEVDIVLSTGQQFSYYLVFQSGILGDADDMAAMATARAIKNIDWSAHGLPVGTTVTSMTITRGTEQTAQRAI